MSGVSDGQYADEDSFNAAFMTRNGDTDTVGKVALNNDDAGSGAHVANTQKFLNQLADTSGVAGEDDANRKVYSSTEYIADGDNRKVAIGKLDAQAKTTQDQVDDHETRITDIESNPSTFGGDKTFTDDVAIQQGLTVSGNTVIGGNLTVNGTQTIVNSTDMQVTDQNILVNKDGNDASAEGAGVDVQRDTDNGAFRFDSTLLSKWKVGVLSDLREVIVNGFNQIVAGVKDFTSGIKTDTISESTGAAGVTIDGVLLKDGEVDGRDVSQDGADLDTHIADVANPHAVTKTQVGLGNVTNDAQLTRAAGDFNSFTNKATPVGADVVLIEDSADSFNKKKATLAALIAGAASGTPGSHSFKANGKFNIYGALTGIDGTFRFPWDANILDVQLVRQVAGASGSTTADVKVKPPAGAWTSILSTLGVIQAAAGDDAAVGVGEVVANTTAPVLSSSPVAVLAGTLMRCDLTTVEVGDNANSFAVIVFFEKQ